MSPNLPLEPNAFRRRFAAAATLAGFQEETYGEVLGHALPAYTKLARASNAPRIYFSAGIHGDEPAAPFALLQLLEANFFDDRCSWFLCPLINPVGFTRGTRENHDTIDLNRDYKIPVSAEVRAHVTWLERQPKFDLVICLHEDWETQGFYLYELNPGNGPSLAPAMIAAALTVCAIEQGPIIDGREIDEVGIIRPLSDPLLREAWPEAIYLLQFHGSLIYTIETPSALPLAQRVETHDAVLRAAMHHFLDNKK